MLEFNDYISDFENITSSTAFEKISNKEDLVIFVGKSVCPFCVKFAPKIANVAKELGQKVYFVDSNNYEDNELPSFREKYNIVTVPGLLVAKNDEVRVFCDSSKTEEFIKEFITK